MSFTQTLNRLCNREALNAEDAEKLFAEILAGDVQPLEISAMLAALRTKGETTDELIGAVRAMRKKMVLVNAPAGAIDTCGTGGDAKGTYNISTTVAIVTAACGVPVAKHGNRSVSSKSGSADVLESLGVHLDLPAEKLSECIEKTGLCFMMAPLFHPAMKQVAEIRRTLGVRTIFNLLGPLLNPASAKRQLMGIFDKNWLLPMAEALHRLGTETAWVVHGSDGLDELTVTGESYITILKDGSISSKTITPDTLGLGIHDLESLAGGEAQTNAEAMRAVLSGDKGAYRDAVALNTGAALTVAGKTESLLLGVQMAQAALDDGSALKTLDSLIEFTQKA